MTQKAGFRYGSRLFLFVSLLITKLAQNIAGISRVFKNRNYDSLIFIMNERLGRFIVNKRGSGLKLELG